MHVRRGPTVRQARGVAGATAIAAWIRSRRIPMVSPVHAICTCGTAEALTRRVFSDQVIGVPRAVLNEGPCVPLLGDHVAVEHESVTRRQRKEEEEADAAYAGLHMPHVALRVALCAATPDFFFIGHRIDTSSSAVCNLRSTTRALRATERAESSLGTGCACASGPAACLCRRVCCVSVCCV